MAEHPRVRFAQDGPYVLAEGFHEPVGAGLENAGPHLTGGLGTRSETHVGRWTGRLASPILHGPAKALAVQDLAQQRGLDLVACHAYSDSTNDQPLLEAVGHPHAVNPDRHLARTAAAGGWTVHRHRSRHMHAAAGLSAARRLTGLSRRTA